MGVSISDAFERYRTDYIIMRNLSPKTEESYTYARNCMITYFTDVDICSLTFNDVRAWQNCMMTKMKPDSVRNHIVCLRMVLKFLASKGVSCLNYNEIPVAKREKRTIKYLTEGEVEAFILDAIKPRRGYQIINRKRNLAILRVLYATGLRNSELCSLDRDSIKNRTFTMIGKSQSERIGFIDAAAEEAINEYLALRTDHNKALFISHQTGQRLKPGNLRVIFQNICDNSSYKGIHPHTIRHSYATKLLEKRVDIPYIGVLIDHASLDSTRIYNH